MDKSVAVASSVVGNAVSRIQTANPDISADHIARALALACGAVLLVVGLIRAGFIVEAISLTVIASFMTGAAISIGVGQIPALLGLQGVNSREATHLVIINTLKALPTARLDAALGMSTLFTLYLWRWFCGFMAEHQPKHKKAWFFASTVRQSCTVILFILLSWLVNRNRARVSASEAAFDILGTVPSGRSRAVLHLAPGNQN